MAIYPEVSAAECINRHVLEMRHHGVEVEFYKINGTSVDGLREELRQKGPKDSAGVSRDAYFGWELKWRWPFSEGRPRFERTVVSFTAKATLPCVDSELNPETKERWERFFEALSAHEAKHLHNLLEGVEGLKEAFRTRGYLNLSEANGVGHLYLKKIRSADIALDHSTDHGKREGVVLLEENSF